MVKVASSKPKSCGALFAALTASGGDATVAHEGCKRLPRHKGEPRATLHRPAVARVTKSAGKRGAKPRVTRAEFAADLAAKVASGDLTADKALSRMAAFVTRKPKARTAKRVDAVVTLLDSDVADAIDALESDDEANATA